MADRLSNNPIHLGLGATAVREPDFTGEMSWYAGYGARHAADGEEGRLVSMHTFSVPWTTWEMHPRGHEVVLCTAGEITLIQESDGETRSVTLKAGEYAINEPGVWHTADVDESATAVFCRDRAPPAIAGCSCPRILGANSRARARAGSDFRNGGAGSLLHSSTTVGDTGPRPHRSG